MQNKLHTPKGLGLMDIHLEVSPFLVDQGVGETGRSNLAGSAPRPRP